jgi:translation initiation factor IF-1
MRFQKGVHYPHPPRGRARCPYLVSDAAQQARRQNLSKTRIRSGRETLTIKLWIWQDTFGDGPHLSQRELARQLGVCRSYIHKVQHQRAEAIDALTRGPRVTTDDLLGAQRFTVKLSEQEPRLLRAVHSSRSEKARALTEDEIIAKTWREVNDWKRKNSSYGGRGWFRW